MRCRRYEGADCHVEAVLSALWFIYHLFRKQGCPPQVQALRRCGRRGRTGNLDAETQESDLWGPPGVGGRGRLRGGRGLHLWRVSERGSHCAPVFSPGEFAVTDTDTLRSASRGLLVSWLSLFVVLNDSFMPKDKMCFDLLHKQGVWWEKKETWLLLLLFLNQRIW